jgi:hypothetical protein
MQDFESSEQLKEILGGFFIHFVDMMTAGDPDYAEVGKALNDTGLVVHFVLRDPNLKIVIDCEEKPIVVSFGDESPKAPTASFSLVAENGHKFWLGEFNLPNALVRKQVVMKGPVARMLKVVPITRKVYPLYRQYLIDNGFEEFT